MKMIVVIVMMVIMVVTLFGGDDDVVVCGGYDVSSIIMLFLVTREKIQFPQLFLASVFLVSVCPLPRLFLLICNLFYVQKKPFHQSSSPYLYCHFQV